MRGTSAAKGRPSEEELFAMISQVGDWGLGAAGVGGRVTVLAGTTSSDKNDQPRRQARDCMFVMISRVGNWVRRSGW